MTRVQTALVGLAVMALVLAGLNYCFSGTPITDEIARLDKAIANVCREKDLLTPSTLDHRYGGFMLAINPAYGSLNGYLDERQAAADKLSRFQRTTLAVVGVSLVVGLVAFILPRRP